MENILKVVLHNHYIASAFLFFMRKPQVLDVKISSAYFIFSRDFNHALDLLKGQVSSNTYSQFLTVDCNGM